ncbi:MAG: tetratricopeptide repeat protein [Anaerolineae bacterium]|nr:tetratricopeptide repeat protein [Anaerolineae bacterium]
MIEARVLDFNQPQHRSGERQRWAAFYESRLRQQLTWAADYVDSHEPTDTMGHLLSFLTLLQQAQRNSHVQAEMLSLIVALHPWPAKWGYWQIWEDTLYYAIQVCQQLDRPELKARFQAALADTLFHTGRLAASIQHARDAAELAERYGATSCFASAAETIVYALRALSRHEDANRELAALSAFLLRPEVHADLSQTEKAEAAARVAWLRLNASPPSLHPQEALETIDRAIGQIETISRPEMPALANGHNLRGIILWRQDDYGAAAKAIETAQEMYAEIGDTFAEASLAGNLGIVYWSMGDFRRAENVLQRCIATTEHLNARWRMTKAIRVLAAVYLGRGRLHQALRYCERHLGLATELGEVAEIAGSKGNRGTVRLHLGEYDLARRDFEEELEIEGDATHIGVGCSLANLSRCYAHLGDRTRAIALAERAWELAELNDSPRLRIVALRCLSEYQPMLQRRADLHRALVLARQHARPFDEAACLYDMSITGTDPSEQIRMWQQGARLLREMGAISWLKGCTREAPPYLPLLV